MIRSSLRPVVAGLVAVAVSIGALGACGGSSDSGNKVTDDAVNRATGMKTSHLKGKTKLDIAANSVTSVLSTKFSDYQQLPRPCLREVTPPQGCRFSIDSTGPLILACLVN